jgi:hypothetical protein
MGSQFPRLMNGQVDRPTERRVDRRTEADHSDTAGRRLKQLKLLFNCKIMLLTSL